MDSRFYSTPSSVYSDSGDVGSMALDGGRRIDKNLYRAPSDEAIEPETLLEEMDQLQEEEFPLPNEVRGIVEASSKKYIIFVQASAVGQSKTTLYILG
jgi:hypothetical protein